MTQRTEVLAYLRQNGSISGIEALESIGCFRLAARVNELRMMGHDIETRMERHRDGMHARYFLRRDQ